eukprot:TRINITY_DN3141_c0_g1_i7.p2 TRINITY_DN3141_c0_g1~~TRINITY_DN3141_c0_g1_i7.p2  ORF type:complete len:160 (-),score=5.37 TRINITY_DN3141_c0_g1_i7:984-1463(-)
MSRYNYTLHATSFTHPTVGSTDSTTQSLVQADFNSITPPPHVQFNKSISIMKKNVILTSFPLLASVNTDQLSLYMEPGSEWLKDQYKEPCITLNQSPQTFPITPMTNGMTLNTFSYIPLPTSQPPRDSAAFRPPILIPNFPKPVPINIRSSLPHRNAPP